MVFLYLHRAGGVRPKSAPGVRFGDSEVTGEQLRHAFGLRSSAVTITVSREDMTFTSRGCGGNTGMSAYSAERLARGGMSAEEIFAYFFPGVAL